MKKTQSSARSKNASGEMRREYKLDYRKAKPNRFARGERREQVFVLLDADVSRVFTTPESVNNALRAILAAVPPTPK